MKKVLFTLLSMVALSSNQLMVAAANTASITNDSNDLLLYTIPAFVDMSLTGEQYEWKSIPPRNVQQLTRKEMASVKNGKFLQEYLGGGSNRVSVSEATKPLPFTVKVELGDDNSKKIRLFSIQGVQDREGKRVRGYNQKVSRVLNEDTEIWEDIFPEKKMSVLEYDLPKNATSFIYKNGQLFNDKDNKLVSPMRIMALEDWEDIAE